jgi:hypothetical protein
MTELITEGAVETMRHQVNIAVVVNVISALSVRSLGGGNLCMMDDGGLGSTGQGGVALHTVCRPGQLVTWEVVALDVQTPVEIHAITFLDPDGRPVADLAEPVPGFDRSTGSPVWSGVLPIGLAPGAVYPYRFEIRMGDGEFSLLHVDTAALVIAGAGPCEGATS